MTASMLNTHIRDNSNALRSEHFSVGATRGLGVRTSYNRTMTTIRAWADEVVMSDGTRLAFPYASQYSADSGTSGAGGVDTGSIATGWWEVHAIAKEDGTKNILLHKAPVVSVAEQGTVSSSTENFRDTSTTQKIAQSFTPGSNQNLFAIDVVLVAIGTVPGSTIYLTLHDNNAGAPAAAELARSSSVSAGSFASTATVTVRFLFPTRPALTSGTVYWFTLNGDFAVSATNYLRIYGNAASGYAGGQALRYNGSAWVAPATVADLYFISTIVGSDVALTMPTGYTKSAKLGYAYYNAGSYGGFHPFVQRGRYVQYESPSSITTTAPAAGVPSLTDVSAFAPPHLPVSLTHAVYNNCLLYTSDAADE